MKRKISIILLLIATLMFSLLAFTACGNNGDKQVPVYQGMTITKSNDSTLSLTSASYRSGGITLLSANNENNGDNGNHYGHYKGDHTDRNDTIDEENPYPDNNANENIEEEIKSSLNVIGSPDTIYYAEPNEDIYINIHIDNPDSFEIMSFTLNGKKYSSYMFEEGSDMETIVLKYNVGNTAGVVEYTIDAIKYIDGTEIKDVIINGNKTVMAGIKTENQVVASVTEVDIDTNALSFNVNVKDNNALVKFSGGALKAVIYDGFNIVSEKDVAIGDNTVTFDGLKNNSIYQYAIVGYYDDLSGNGFGMNILCKDAFYTDSVVLFDDITIGQESISFSYIWHEDHQGKTITSLKLYKRDVFVKDIAVNASSINELLSNTTYKLVAEYPGADKTESIYIEFTTLAKTTPSFTVKNEDIGTNGINAEYEITDADNILATYKVELYKGDTLVSENPENNISFNSLSYYTDYTLKITYTYDLNDGNGVQTSIFEKAYKTLAYIGVASCNIANANAIRVGDTVFMQINVDNPLQMSVESVVINGKVHQVTGATNGNKIFVEIACDDSFAGGLTEFRVDKINAKIDGTTYTVIPENELCTTAFINGTVTILGKYTANTNFEQIDWGVVDQKVYRVIKLNNPTGYNIRLYIYNESITLHKIDDNTYYYEDTLELDYGSGGGWDGGYIITVLYENEHMSGTATYKLDYTIDKSCYVLESDEIKYVSSVADLLNMKGRHYFKMTNDIDLIGINWTGAGFSGIFDANGYSIKNMTSVGDSASSLFKSSSGIIQNLNVVNATIVAKHTGNQYYDSGFGIIMSRGHAIYIRNCSIDEGSTLNTVGYMNVGGICGYAAYNTRIENCQMRAVITPDIAIPQGIANCQSDSLIVLDCLSLYDQTDDNGATVKNTYNANTPAVKAQLNSMDFYTKTLNWSEEVWDLTDLDVENGKYPKLKQKP